MEKIMRSLIYVDCAKEEYRIKLHRWLYKTHVPESISQFQPYVSKYAFYECLPTPPGGEKYGTIRKQLTEHYWCVNPMDASMAIKVFTETFPTDVLIWQGNLPDSAAEMNYEGDDARATRVENCNPFVFAFMPLTWQEDYKGAGRTESEGPNYRWNFCIKYPDGISIEEGDKWLKEKMIPAFVEMPEVNRLVSNLIIKEVNGCPMDRVIELWTDGPDEWCRVVEKAQSIEKPEWAQVDSFPYLTPYQNIMGAFVADYVTSDNLAGYHGYITMR